MRSSLRVKSFGGNDENTDLDIRDYNHTDDEDHDDDDDNDGKDTDDDADADADAEKRRDAAWRLRVKFSDGSNQGLYIGEHLSR